MPAASSAGRDALLAVVDVDRLNADAPRAGHLSEEHLVGQKTGPDLLLGGLDVDRGVLVQERPWLDEHGLPVTERSLEDVAVAMQEQQTGVTSGHEPVHEHAVAAVERAG